MAGENARGPTRAIQIRMDRTTHVRPFVLDRDGRHDRPARAHADERNPQSQFGIAGPARGDQHRAVLDRADGIDPADREIADIGGRNPSARLSTVTRRGAGGGAGTEAASLGRARTIPIGTGLGMARAGPIKLKAPNVAPALMPVAPKKNAARINQDAPGRIGSMGWRGVGILELPLDVGFDSESDPCILYHTL
jgi:hypothetical protein